jgi:uncharacterized membrane protein YphA (DoxX/SURF4 family)
MNDIFAQLIGLIYIAASIHRVYLKKEREQELIVSGLPRYSDYLIILFELIVGILLLINVSYKKNILKLFLLFIIIACIVIFFRNYKKILESYNEIWTFQPTAMSFSMHLYIIFIVLLLLYKD